MARRRWWRNNFKLVTMDIWQILSRGSDIVQVLSAAVAIAIAAQANTLRRRYLFQLRVPKYSRQLLDYAGRIAVLLDSPPLDQEKMRDELTEIATKLALLQKRLHFWSMERRRIKKLHTELLRILKARQMNESSIREIYRNVLAAITIINSIHQDFQLR
jgi:hypothetical protein